MVVLEKDVLDNLIKFYKKQIKINNKLINQYKKTYNSYPNKELTFNNDIYNDSYLFGIYMIIESLKYLNDYYNNQILHLLEVKENRANQNDWN
jgi:uncharacterized membrane protein YkgB